MRSPIDLYGYPQFHCKARAPRSCGLRVCSRHTFTSAGTVLNPMLRLPRHSSTRVVRALREPAALGRTVSIARPCSIWRRDLASSRPHDNTPPPLVPRSAVGSADRHHRSVLVSGWLHTSRRRTVVDAREGPGLLARPRAAATLVTQQQWRGLAAAGKGKGKGGKDGGGEEEGMFGRLKKTFEEEIEKVRSCQQRTVGCSRCFCCCTLRS